ncbi:MAG: A24 family peptidase [Nanoarchaeota archaeon]|nr:A24 family peptidase [Nanoarchaeota archaeon]
MFELYIIYSIVLIALLIGTYTDFKVREVPDWISYGMIFAGLGLRSIFSLVYWDWHMIVDGLLGFGMFLLLAFVMFYAGQWGGGDAKVLMGLGALLGVQLSPDTFLLGFLINTVLFGSIFGLFFSIFLAIKHKHVFAKKAQEIYYSKTKMKYFFWAGTAFVLILAFAMPLVQIPLFMMAALVFVTFYLLVFMKGVEEACMIKQVDPERLTEGDWIVNDVIVAGKRICGPKDLGIEKRQIDELIKLKKQNKIATVAIKEGIPFVPSFLMGFIATLLWGNLMFVVLSSL